MQKQWQSADLSGTVLRRRVGAELLNLLGVYGEIFFSLGERRLPDIEIFPTRAAFRAAVHRLKKAGLLVVEERDGTKRLVLTDPARAAMASLYRPDKLWDTEWNGYWYLFLYDVPETSREYRDVLRRFLKLQKMGCLQKSVYVTPRDIRPAFADLCDGADVGRYAYLFRSETVLGMDAMQIVRNAWPWEALHEQHKWYHDSYGPRLEKVCAGEYVGEELRCMAREEMKAYESVMTGDPLLPRDLLPEHYLGGAVLGIHQAFIDGVKANLKKRGK